MDDRLQVMHDRTLLSVFGFTRCRCGIYSIPAEIEKKILSMYADNDIPVMCQTCAIITTARAEADDLSLTWGLYTWLPNPKQRTVEPSLWDMAQETRKCAFGDYHCDFF